MRFESPSGSAAIEIWQTRWNNGFRGRVELVNGAGRSVLYELPREAGIYFVHVYWSPDGSTGGVLASGFVLFKIAFQTKTGRLIPFDEIRQDFSRSIAETYRLPKGEDPLVWATLSDAQHEFSKHHPEVRLSYQR